MPLRLLGNSTLQPSRRSHRQIPRAYGSPGAVCKMPTYRDARWHLHRRSPAALCSSLPSFPADIHIITSLARNLDQCGLDADAHTGVGKGARLMEQMLSFIDALVSQRVPGAVGRSGFV
ncbi:hypothetical protein LIA77_01648 [Sarocladium implicatum]|nr:hypothetical protein LIA77_01648 [Sarocladium implicatum]